MSNERIAMAIAAPIALAAAVGVFFALKPSPAPTPEPTPTVARPQATTPVTMDSPKLDDRQATVCRALVSQLPEKIRDQERRAVTAGHEQNAAYGEPAVTVACGVPQPKLVNLTDPVFPMNNVCWYRQTKGDSTVWTTIDREVAVAVTTPSTYDGQWVIPFSTTITATVPSSAEKPFGCKAS